MKYFLTCVVLWLASQAIGQTISSVQSGSWEDPSTWGGIVPTASNSTLINVLHSVTVTTFYGSANALTLDQTTIGSNGNVVVDAGAYLVIANGAGNDLTFAGTGQANVSGRLTFANGVTLVGNTASNFKYLSGSTYEHGYTAATANLPTASYGSTSTILINKIAVTGSLPVSWAVPVGHVVIDVATLGGNSLNLAGNLINVAGDLSIQNTGTTGRVYFNQIGVSTVANSNPILIGGNFSITGSSRVFHTNTGTTEVYVGGNFVFSPTAGTTASGNSAFTGSGLLQVAGNSNFSNAQWNFSAGTNGSGTLNVKGDLTVSSALTESGAGTSQGTIHFTGTSPQSFNASGSVITNTLNFNFDNPAGVQLNSDLLIPATGSMGLTSGILTLNSVNLSVNGLVSQSGGSISTMGTPSLLISGSGSLPPDLTIQPGSVFAVFQLNRVSSTLATSSNFTVNNSLQLYAGTVVNSGTITMLNGSLVDVKAGVLSNPLTASGGSYSAQYTNNLALSTGAELPSNASDLFNLTKLGTGVLTLTKDVTVQGDLTISAGTVTDGAIARTVTLNGNYISNGVGTWSASTFNFNGIGRILSGVRAPTFLALHVNGNTSVTNTLGLRVNGNLLVNGVSLTASAGTISFGGTTVITLVAPGVFDVNALTVLANSSLTLPSSSIRVAGNFSTVNASSVLDANHGTVVFNGNTVLGGSGTKMFSDITIAPSSTLSGAVNLGVTGSIVNNGTISFTGGALTINGDVSLSGSGANQFRGITINPTFTFTSSMDFKISSNLVGNGNLICDPGTTVTFNGATILSGNGTKNFDMLAIASASALTTSRPYTVTGNFTIDGTLNQGSSTVIFAGSSPSALSGAGTATFNNITTNAAPSGVLVSIPITVAGTSILNNGSFVLSAPTTFSRMGITTLSGSGTASFGDVSINTGTTLTTSQSYSVGGNLTVNGNLNSVASTTVTFDGTTAITTTGTPAIAFTSLSISGALLSYSGNITVNGNFAMSGGSFDGNGGTITFSGNTTKIISGVSSATFSNVKVNNGTANPDLSFSSTHSLAGVLTLAANAVVNSGGFLRLISTGDNPAIDASIAALPAGADVQGDVIIQRFMSAEPAPAAPLHSYPLGKQGIYRYISSPVMNAVVSQWQSSFSITGNFTGASTTDPTTGTNVVCGITMNPAAASMFYWDEPTQKYVAYPSTNSSAPITLGKGYSGFIRNCLAPVIIQVSGPIYKANSVPFDFASQMTYTSSGSNASLYGFNLVGNPFPSSIDWGATTGWNRSGISPIIAITDNGGTGNGTLRYLDASTDPGQYVASGQAFWVRATGPSFTLNATEDVKATGSYQFYREINPSIDQLEIAISDGLISDKAIYKLNAFSRPVLDNYDGPKLDNSLLNLSTVSVDKIKMAINSTNELSCHSTILIDVAIAGQNPATNEAYSVMPDGSYTLNFSLNGKFKSYALILYDAYTKASQNISGNPTYSFSASTNHTGSNTSNRFSIQLSDKMISLDNPVDSNLKICGSAPAIIVLKNPSADLHYFATLHDQVVSDTLRGIGSQLQFSIPSTKVKIGFDTIVFKAVGACNTYALSHVSIVQRDLLYQAKATSINRCGAGSARLTASGAPSNGNYNWYSRIDDPAPVFVGEVFDTHLMVKDGTYFVAAVNGFGCAGERVPVNVRIVEMQPATIQVLSDLVTLQSNYTSGNQWYESGELLAGETNQRLQPLHSGTYTVAVSSSGCTVQSQQMPFAMMSEPGSADINHKYYPNPTEGIVTFEVKLPTETVGQVIDNLGRAVGKINFTILQDEIYIGKYDFSCHAPGIYFVRVPMSNTSIQSFKIIRK